MSELYYRKVSRGDILAILSQATELAMGQTGDFALRSCVLSVRLAKLLLAGTDTVSEVYFQSQLRYLGCNADAQAMATLLGDEISFRRDFAKIDPGRPGEMASLVFRHLVRANRGHGLMGLVTGVLKGMATAHARQLGNPLWALRSGSEIIGASGTR